MSKNITDDETTRHFSFVAVFRIMVIKLVTVSTRGEKMSVFGAAGKVSVNRLERTLFSSCLREIFLEPRNPAPSAKET